MMKHTKAAMIPLALAFASTFACTAEPSPDWVAPQTEELACDAWAKVPQREAIYFNNVWNVQAADDFAWTQCVVRDPADGERLGFYWNWPNSGRDIYAQPQTKIGMSPWDPLPRLDTRFPIGIGSIETMRVATEVEIDGPTEHNIVTTLWLTDNSDVTTEAKPESIVAEVMIWTYATADHLSPAGRKVGTVIHSGAEWEIWLDESWHDVSGANPNKWIYVAFVAKDQGFAAEFDPVALLRTEPLAHLDFDSAHIADVELGAEIMRGKGVMWIDQFDVSIEGR
ncbi:GH12 family glycosyl hydrolase domain-containing protein [Erythrobacter sp. W53]|uniref:GH12 family glycosyl hydrolase domain-containing protein n=1 Tax=Erythrobacter sp. W53 TaxID=3425947 RepID=UPI003D766AA8